MTNDLSVIASWWATIFVLGAAAFPLTDKLFPHWNKYSHLISKVVGLGAVSFIVLFLGWTKIAPFEVGSIITSLFFVFGFGFFVNRHPKIDSWQILKQEFIFLGALLFWSWIKGHEPSIHGLEKFMDYGFTQSILNSKYFPPLDMWLAGKNYINYYYFGHLTMAVITKFSGVGLEYGFNLMLVSIFAFCFTLSGSILHKLTNKWLVALIFAYLLTLGGNLQTIYAFTKGYTLTDKIVYPPPFWEILSGKIDPGYWYANATRFIPYTIHEFPGYSFVVSDVHGHVLSIPFVLLMIVFLIESFYFKRLNLYLTFGTGILGGILFMTNALDGPIYFGLFSTLLFVTKNNWKEKIKHIGLISIFFVITVMPFISHFKSFVTGVAVNCPPNFLANSKFGPLLFEGVEKCQRSPVWMMLLLWGVFVYLGTWYFIKLHHKKNIFMSIAFVYSLALILFAEFFYFKDIYPMHFRSNTMFKLGYQAFILSYIAGGWVTWMMIKNRNLVFWILGVPLFLLSGIFPYFSINSYFGQLSKYQGLDGTVWIQNQYPSDWAAIVWINDHKQPGDVLVEADGDSYTDYARVSTYTGIPTIIGWGVHEWLWRGGYDIVPPKKEEVRQIYEDPSSQNSKLILSKYNVKYIFVGILERNKFTKLDEVGLSSLGKKVFEQNQTSIFQVHGK